MLAKVKRSDFYLNRRLNTKLRCDENSKNKQSNQNQKD